LPGEGLIACNKCQIVGYHRDCLIQEVQSGATCVNQACGQGLGTIIAYGIPFSQRTAVHSTTVHGISVRGIRTRVPPAEKVKKKGRGMFWLGLGGSVMGLMLFGASPALGILFLIIGLLGIMRGLAAD